MAYYPASTREIYNQITIKAGDTIAATAVETNFASSVVLPANSLVAGMTLYIKFAGVYSTPAVAPPTTTAKVKIGTTAVVTTPALSNPTGANGLGYSGDVIITVQSTGTSGVIRASGTLTFNNTTTGSITVVVPQPTTLPTVDTTVNQTLQLAALFSAATAGNSNTLQQLIIYETRPPKASS